MHQLDKSRLPRVHPLFHAPHLGYIYESILAGHTAADVWADDPEDPATAFIWDGVHSYYFAGADTDALAAGLSDLLAREIAPEAVRRGRAFFKVVCATDGWAARLPDLFAPVPIRSFPRTCFAAVGAVPSDGRGRLPEGFRVEPITAAILEGPVRPNLDDLLGEVRQMWGTVEHFLANGFGWCALAGDAVAGWCTAEYLGPAACGLGVETVEEFQRRGLATVLAAASLETARSRGLRAHWDAWTGNTPSVRVAEKAGLARVSDYTATVGTWPEE